MFMHEDGFLKKTKYVAVIRRQKNDGLPVSKYASARIE
jgi:hypothetical protein